MKAIKMQRKESKTHNKGIFTATYINPDNNLLIVHTEFVPTAVNVHKCCFFNMWNIVYDI